MAGRGRAGRGLGSFLVERRFEGDGRPPYDDPGYPPAWGGRGEARGEFDRGGRGKSDLVCYVCQKPGHMSYVCPNPPAPGRFPGGRGPFLKNEREIGYRAQEYAHPPNGRANGSAFDAPPPDRWHPLRDEYGGDRFAVGGAMTGGGKGGCFVCGQPGHFAKNCPHRGELPPPRARRFEEDVRRSPPHRGDANGVADRQWMYVDLEGALRGPYPLRQLHKWLQEGFFQSTQLVCLQGSHDTTTLGRALTLRQGITAARPLQDAVPHRREVPLQRAAERPPPPREGRFDRRPVHQPLDPSPPRPSSRSPAKPPHRPPVPPPQLPRLQIPDALSAPPSRPPLSVTPPSSTTPSVAPTPSIPSSVSPSIPNSASPTHRGFASMTLPANGTPISSTPMSTSPEFKAPAVRLAATSSPPAVSPPEGKERVWGHGGPAVEEETATPYVQWESGYDGTSDLSGSEPGSPMHMSPRAALGQQLLEHLDSPKQSITERVEGILHDGDIDDESTAEQRMDTVIGILGRRLLDREAKEEREMRSFAYGSHPEAEPEVPTVSAWKHGYGFGEMAAAEARGAPANEYALPADLFFHAYGPGNSGKGGQQFYHDEEAALGEPEPDPGAAWELAKEREKQDPAKWLLRGGDWKLEHDPQLRVEDDTGNPPPPCKYVLNRGQPICEAVLPEVDPEAGEGPKDPRLGGKFRAAVQEAVRADYAKLEVPLFGREGIPRVLQIDLERRPPSGHLTASPSPSITSPSENVRPPVPTKKILKKQGIVAKKGVLKKAPSLPVPSSIVGNGGSSGALSASEHEARPATTKVKAEGGDKARSESPAGRLAANGLTRTVSQVAPPKASTLKDSPSVASDRGRLSKWDAGTPPAQPRAPSPERAPKKLSLAEAVLAAKRAQLGAEAGQWFYLDGQGQLKGPHSFPHLRIMATRGEILEGISAWRPEDNTWVPITKQPLAPKEPIQKAFGPGPPLPGVPGPWSRGPMQGVPPWDSRGRARPMPFQPPLPLGPPPGAALLGLPSKWEDAPKAESGSDRRVPVPLLAMVRGKLHEQVVKTARTKVLDAAIDAALQEWLWKKVGGPVMREKGEGDAATRRTGEGERSEEAQAAAQPAVSRAIDGGGAAGAAGASEALEEGRPMPVDDSREPSAGEAEDPEMSKSVEKFLRSRRSIAYIFLDACKSPRGGMDMALLARYACVCRGFRKGAELARQRMFKADFSVLGERCTDAALKSLETAGEGLVKFVYLNGCVNVTPEAVDDLLRAQPSIRCVDIQGCVQVYSLARSTPAIKWRNLPEALVELPGGANALPPEQAEDQQKRREKFAKARQLRGIERVLDEIRRLDEAKIFLVPVSEEQYPTYSKIIQRPIALVTMRQRLKGRYLPLGKGVDRFREDMDLMFDNARRFNREGTFYYSEADRLQKVANKLMDSLEARVKGTLDGTVPVRKGSHRRADRSQQLPKSAELELSVQARLGKTGMQLKTPRRPGEADALPSISASSIDDSYRAGADEASRDGELARKRKVRGEEREELDSSKRRREDSDAESNRSRGKRVREEEEPDEGRGGEKRGDVGKRVEFENRRPGSALLAWEVGDKRRRTETPKVPRVDMRGLWSQDAEPSRRGFIDAKAPAERAAARRARQALDVSESESEDWADEETEEEQEDESEAESIDEIDAEDVSDEEPEDHRAWAMADDLADRTTWGAKMTKATMVPPVSRKYQLIDEYAIVSDTALVQKKMEAHLPDAVINRLTLREHGARGMGAEDIMVHSKKARKVVGEEVLEQEVYGIDPFTHNLLLDTMQKNAKGFTEDDQRRDFIEQPLLMALNRCASAYTGYARVPESLDLKVVVQVVRKEAEDADNKVLAEFAQALHERMEKRPQDKYLAYRKGLGVVCNRAAIHRDDFVVEFHGEVYPPYRWYEKEDEIRRLQKKEVAPEFYNIMLERPKADLAGYDLLVIDAMHKANFASRLCHSCTPNCATKVACVDGRYIIGLYAIADVRPGEELTFNYHSVTESKEEHEHAVCLCGSRQCAGSYLNFAGSTSFLQVMNKRHGGLDRHHLLLTACQDPTLDAADCAFLERAGFRSSLLEGLPPWAVKYAAQVVAFIFLERELLPGELVDTKAHKRRNAIDMAHCRQAAQDEAEGVESQRLQNLGITLDKVRHCLTSLCRCPAKDAPPPLRLLSAAEVVQRLWTGEDSVVQQIRRYLDLHVDDVALGPILEELQARQPQENEEGLSAMRASLLWLRDTLIGLDIKPTARHDAAADLLSMYAHTKDFFTHAEYVAASFESEPVTIVAMDLGVKESTFPPKTVRKAYKPYFVWGQLINWYKQSVADPGATLNNVRRGCLTLPDPASCYSASSMQAIPRGYGRKQRARMLDKYITNKVQGPWPKQEQHWLWSHNIRGLYGTPWFDAIRSGQPVDPALVHWLRTRPVFEGPYDHGR